MAFEERLKNNAHFAEEEPELANRVFGDYAECMNDIQEMFGECANQ